MDSKGFLAAVAAVVIAAATIAACSPRYVVRAAYEEAKLLWRREPIEGLLRDGSVGADRREKLAIVLAARAFARDVIGLSVDGSYTSISEVDGNAVVHLLSAARHDRLESYTWWFPIVGKVPYKGFFSKAEALRAADALERQGYDTYVRPAIAFSTLGWFDDPLPSTLLERRAVLLAGVVFHELFHSTVFLRGKMSFNESAANFVGQRAAIEFFCNSPGAEEACAEARAEWADTLQVSRFLAGVIEELEDFYAASPGGAVLEAGRRRILRDVAERALALELTGNRYADFSSAPLNNATLLHDRVYLKDLDLFEALYQERGRLSAVVAELKDLAEEQGDNPWAGLRDLLGRPSLELASQREDGPSIAEAAAAPTAQ